MATFDELIAEVEAKPAKSTLDQYFDLIDQGAPVKGAAGRPKIEPAAQSGIVESAWRSVRDSDALTNLLGPSERVLMEESIPVSDAEGNVSYQYRPLGNRLEREGLANAGFVQPQAVIDELALNPLPQDSVLSQVGKGVARAGIGIGASLTNPLNLAMVPAAIPAVTARTGTGLNRALSGAFGAEMLAEVPESAQRVIASETPGELAEGITSLTLGAGLGGLGVYGALRRADLPLTSEVLSKTRNAKTETTLPERVSETKEQPAQQPTAAEVAPIQEPGASQPGELTVSPDVARAFEEQINEPTSIQPERPAVAEAQAEAPQETQTQEVANELPEITADVPSLEAQTQAQRSILDAIEAIQRPVESTEQGAGRGDVQAQTPEQQLGSLGATLPKITEGQLSSLEDRRTKTTEHDVYFSPDRDRYVKVLQRNQFGLVPKRDAEGRIGLEKATLAEYLNRLRLTNEVFGTDISIEGIARRADELDEDKTSADLVISQKNIRPADSKNANPTQAQIDEFMRSEGFEPAAGTHKWTRAADGLLVGDAKPDNFILTENGVVPIDLLISQEPAAETAQPTTQNAKEYSQGGRPDVANQDEGSPREVVGEKPEDTPGQGQPTEEVITETGPTPVIGKWDGANYGPRPIIAFKDKSSGDIYISPNDRIHALGLGNLVAEGNTNLVKASNRESGFLIGNEFVQGSLQNPKDGPRIAAAMEKAAEPVIVNKKVPEEGPGSIFPESEREAIQIKAYQDAETIGRTVAKGQGDTIIEAAIQAARDNADRNIRNNKRPNPEFMRKSAKSAAQKAVEKAETSLETPIGEETTLGETIPEVADTAADLAEIQDARVRFNEVIKSFPEGERNVLTLMQEGLSNSEIAQRLGIKENAVRSLQSRGLNKLRNSPYILGITPENKFGRWFTENFRRLFVAEGDLPTDVFHRATERTGELKERSREIAYATRDLYDALKAEFKIGRGEEFFKGMSRIPKEFVSRMNDALLGKVPMDTLPESVRAPLQTMRNHVDALSQRMIDEGLIPEELKAVVDDNMGVYLTRSYRMFDDPKWREKITPEIYNKALNFITKENQKSNPAYTLEDGRRDVDAMLQDWQDQGTGALIKKGAKLGSKDLSSFIRRKDIPEELRNLLGEYKNPVINYARSVTKMANLMANERFLRDVRQMGLGKFLFEDGTQPRGYDALIAAPESRVMAPLNGLRTTPQIAAAFAEFNKVDPKAKGLWRLWLQANAAAKTSKTVGSLMTQVRNTMGQPYFWLMNGHFNPLPLGGAGQSIFADILGNNKKWQEAYKRYLRLGVVDQSTAASELRDVLSDAGLSDPNLDQFDNATIALSNLRKYTLGAAEKSYQLSDDIGKIVGFENELATQKAIHPDLPIEEVEQIAAQRIRNTYPTYSMVPEWVRQFRKQPFFGPFVTFAYEAYRTFAHNLKYAAEDLQSSNPAQRAAGARRAAGIMAVLAGGYGLSAVSRAILGISPEESDDARQFMAPWDKNSQLLFTNKSPEKLSFVNLSYANPYSGISDLTIPIVSGLNSGEGADEIAGNMFAEAIQPFANEGILAAKLIDVARNQTVGGREIYNPADPDKAGKIMGHIAEALEPGTLTRFRKKIIPAIQGKTTSYGEQLSAAQEIGAELTGVKQQTLDYAQALGYKASNFREGDNNSERIFRDVALRRGTVEAQEITDSYIQSNRARLGQWQQMYRAIRAAQRRGVSDAEIRSSLLARNVTQKDTWDLLRGLYRPYAPSPYLISQLRERQRELPQEVKDEFDRTNGLSLDSDLK